MQAKPQPQPIAHSSRPSRQQLDSNSAAVARAIAATEEAPDFFRAASSRLSGPGVISPGFAFDFSQMPVHPEAAEAATLPTGPDNVPNSALPPDVQAKMESSFGSDFSGININPSSTQAADLGVSAFTQGENMHFAPGQYNPTTLSGQRLLGHELAHVVQQRQGRVAATAFTNQDLAYNSSPTLEQEADRMGEWAAQGQPIFTSPVAGPVAQPGVMQGKGDFKYVSAVSLERRNSAIKTAGLANRGEKPANALTIKQIRLPGTFRPHTQYGRDQKAHSISWTLLKQAYEAISELPLNEFLEKYLEPDWQALRNHQAPIMENFSKKVEHDIDNGQPITKHRNKKYEAYAELNKHLNKYDSKYFNKLKSANTPLNWYQKVQSAITDYFIALQLAPLSTNSGYTTKGTKRPKDAGVTATDDIYAAGIGEAQPSGHGEPGANMLFNSLEKYVKGETSLAELPALNYYAEPADLIQGVVKIEFDKIKSNEKTPKQLLAEVALRYWDPGNGNLGGINVPIHLAYLAEEFMKSFARVFPKTAELIKDELTGLLTEEIKSTIDANDDEPEVDEIVKDDDAPEVDEIVKDNDAPEVEEPEDELEVVTAASTTTAQTPVVDDVKAEDIGLAKGGFQIGLTLSEKPNGGSEKFPSADYLLKSINLSNDRPPTKFLVKQKSHTVAWTLVLQSLQNIGSNTSLNVFLQNLLVKWTSLSNQNWDRMISKDLIAKKPWLNQFNRLRLMNLKSRIASNLTIIKAAILGEEKTDLEWNNFLLDVISDYILVYQSAPLTTWNKGSVKGQGEGDTNKFFRNLEASIAANKLSQEEVAKVIDKAKKFKDVNLNTVKREEKNIGVANYAKILHEWEIGLKEAYPGVWEAHYGAVEKTSEEYFTPDGSLNWINPMTTARTAHALAAVRSGILAGTISDNVFRSVLTEYTKATEDYRSGITTAAVGSASLVAQAVSEDYKAGLKAIRLGDIRGQTEPAANQAKEDYQEGLDAVKIAANIQIDDNIAYAAAVNDYKEGFIAAAVHLVMEANKSFGYQVGFADARKPTRVRRSETMIQSDTTFEDNTVKRSRTQPLATNSSSD